MSEIPNMPVPDLSQLKTFDPRQLPDAIHLEFTLIDYSYFIDEVLGGGHRARFEFWTPMLPFVKFSIPWNLESLKELQTKVNRTVELMEEMDNAPSAPEAENNGSEVIPSEIEPDSAA